MSEPFCFSFCSLLIIIMTSIFLATPSILFITDYNHQVTIDVGQSIITSIDWIYWDYHFYKVSVGLDELTDSICKRSLPSIDTYNEISKNGYELFGRYFCSGPDGVLMIPSDFWVLKILLWVIFSFSIFMIFISFLFHRKYLFHITTAYIVIGMLMFIFCIYLHFVEYFSGLWGGYAGVLLPVNVSDYIVLHSRSFFAYWSVTYYFYFTTSIILCFICIVVMIDHSRRDPTDLDGTRN